jgi:hypothetical protein
VIEGENSYEVQNQEQELNLMPDIKLSNLVGKGFNVTRFYNFSIIQHYEIT